jgi:hypothetical protein
MSASGVAPESGLTTDIAGAEVGAINGHAAYFAFCGKGFRKSKRCDNQNSNVMLTTRMLAAASIRISGRSLLLKTPNMGTLMVPDTLATFVIERRRNYEDADITHEQIFKHLGRPESPQLDPKAC